jgi:methyl-accepting chemotaxis protein
MTALDKIKTLFDKKQKSHLRRRLIAYFLLLSLVYLAFGAFLIMSLNKKGLQEEVYQNAVGSAGQGEPDYKKVFSPLEKLQTKLSFVLIAIGIVSSLTTYFFVKDIEKPLKEMVKSAKRMSEGYLNETMPICSSDEIGQIGEIMNDIASNFQEILLYASAISKSSKGTVEELNEALHNPNCGAATENIEAHLVKLRGDMSELEEIVHSFKFFDVKIENGKITDDSQSYPADEVHQPANPHGNGAN